MGARRGGGKGRQLQLPPGKKLTMPFATFSLCRALLLSFSPYGRAFLHHIGAFATFFLHMGSFFVIMGVPYLGLPPPPYENFCGGPCL